jgi:LAO/AO transport system kinase
VENSNKDVSALSEKSGVASPEKLSKESAALIKNFRKNKPTAADLIKGILAGDLSSLSRGITVVESTNSTHVATATEIINQCLPHANRSIRIGITGVPGVGKSTFIEAFGKHLTGLGKKVAVLAVDPSSSVSFGSILGDKTRMEDLVKDKNAFIRPSPSGATLGGVSRKTRESITLCEAFGFNVILVETVGVGQSETAVHGMVDFFLLLKISGAGDELQGIKRGIMEMADAIVINKCDGDNIKNAQQARADFGRALGLFPAKKSGFVPKALTCSSISGNGIAEIWDLIKDYEALTKSNHFFDNHRLEQNQNWMFDTINEQLKSNFYEQENVKVLIETNKKAVQNNEISPFFAAQLILNQYFAKK